MRGGTGNDTYIVDNVGDQITEIDGAGTDKIRSYIDFDLADAANVENLQLLGSSAINATGNNSSNIIRGNSVANTLLGLEGDDILFGGGGNDIFQINTGAGRDLIIDYSSGEDRIELLNGIDYNSLTQSVINGNTNIYYSGDLMAIVQNTISSDISFI